MLDHRNQAVAPTSFALLASEQALVQHERFLQILSERQQRERAEEAQEAAHDAQDFNTSNDNNGGGDNAVIVDVPAEAETAHAIAPATASSHTVDISV